MDALPTYAARVLAKKKAALIALGHDYHCLFHLGYVGKDHYLVDRTIFCVLAKDAK